MIGLAVSLCGDGGQDLLISLSVLIFIFLLHQKFDLLSLFSHPNDIIKNTLVEAVSHKTNIAFIFFKNTALYNIE